MMALNVPAYHVPDVSPIIAGHTLSSMLSAGLSLQMNAPTQLPQPASAMAAGLSVQMNAPTQLPQPASSMSAGLSVQMNASAHLLQPALTMSAGFSVQANNAEPQGQGASNSVTTTAHLVYRSPTEELSAVIRIDAFHQRTLEERTAMNTGTGLGPVDPPRARRLPPVPLVEDTVDMIRPCTQIAEAPEPSDDSSEESLTMNRIPTWTKHPEAGRK